MSLNIGIVGLPNVGKTTIFNAIGRGHAQVAAYPFTTVEPNVGTVMVPDDRLELIAKTAGSDRLVPATVRFVDIAGLVEGASKGEGLGNRFLANIREVDAVMHVVRAFEDPDISHVAGSVDPLHDAELVLTELALADLETLERRKAKTARASKAGDAVLKKELAVLEELGSVLEGGKPPPASSLSAEQLALAQELSLLCFKPVMVVLNLGEGAGDSEEAYVDLVAWAKGRGYQVVGISGKVEAELSELEPGEAREFMEEMGVDEGGLEKVIRTGYDLLGLMTFFTIDSGECKAWPILRGSHASGAAGKIHTDMEKGFVRAEVVGYEKFLSSGSMREAREEGELQVEGRDYVVQDGDIIHFKFTS